MHICTGAGNLSQNNSKIVIDLHCHNLGLYRFCHRMVEKSAKNVEIWSVPVSMNALPMS